MILKLVSVAVLAVAAGLGAAIAQSAGDFGGPRELPPASFTGQQYVDSRGCVFLRAGLGGRTNWVPRVSRDRAQLCGYPPTFGANQVVINDPAPDPAPAARPERTARAAPSPAPEPTPVGRKPLDTVASITTPPKIRSVPSQRSMPEATYVPAPIILQPTPRKAAPAPRVAAPTPPKAEATRGIPAQRAATGTGSTGGKIGCYSDAPVAERFAVQNGGSVVMCTRGDGDIANARPPRVLEGAAAVSPSGYLERPGAAPKAQRVVISSQDSGVPKGYKPAFKDDRFNPDRAKGTREGWAAQDQIWTKQTPARLVEDVQKAKRKKVAVRKVYVSSKSEQAPAKVQKPQATGRSFVQIGTFGQPANADGASSKLSQLGLPVARSKITKNGKAMQIVMAGPFGSQAEAKAALSAARRAGFGDAFIR